jgi:hypothetical protein
MAREEANPDFTVLLMLGGELLRSEEPGKNDLRYKNSFSVCRQAGSAYNAVALEMR